MTPRLPLLALSLAVTTALLAQAPQQYSTQPQPAPVERSAPDFNPGGPMRPPQPRVLTVQPASGISVRSTMPVETVANVAGKVELRLAHGVANVTVHHPAKNTLIQFDLPGGQAVLVHDGLYTFNADTGTLRVLHGEAVAYLGANGPAKGIKVKEEHQLLFAANARSEDLNLADVRTDLLANPAGGDRGYAVPYGYYPAYYPYPYYAYGYPWGYPYVGFGFGWGGGWGGGFYGGRGFRR